MANFPNMNLQQLEDEGKQSLLSHQMNPWHSPSIPVMNIARAAKREHCIAAGVCCALTLLATIFVFVVWRPSQGSVLIIVVGLILMWTPTILITVSTIKAQTHLALVIPALVFAGINILMFGYLSLAFSFLILVFASSSAFLMLVAFLITFFVSVTLVVIGALEIKRMSVPSVIEVPFYPMTGPASPQSHLPPSTLAASPMQKQVLVFPDPSALHASNAVSNV